MNFKNLFRFRIKKLHIIGVSLALTIVLLSFLFIKTSSPNLFYFLLGIAFFIAGAPFLASLIIDTNLTREKDEMFLEFSRNLVESVKTGTPISKSILNIKTKDFGNLNPYIEKLANQISLGIPLKTALETFARDAGSPTITRAITIISESEKAGGEIEDILESVAGSVAQVEKLRKERRSAMYSLVMQGYIIFLIFIVIMLVMQYRILPIASGLSEGVGGADTSVMGGTFGAGLIGGKTATPQELTKPFLWLLLVQGFFVGLVIGKISEGEIKYGLKHSFILIVLASLIYTGAALVMGK